MVAPVERTIETCPFTVLTDPQYEPDLVTIIACSAGLGATTPAMRTAIDAPTAKSPATADKTIALLRCLRTSLVASID
jgi:hypothetical protein